MMNSSTIIENLNKALDDVDKTQHHFKNKNNQKGALCFMLKSQGLKQYQYYDFEIEYDWYEEEDEPKFVENYKKNLHNKNAHYVNRNIKKIQHYIHSKKDVDVLKKTYRNSIHEPLNYVVGDVSLGEGVNTITDMCKFHKKWRKIRKNMVITLESYERKYSRCVSVRQKDMGITNNLEENPFTEYLKVLKCFERTIDVDMLEDVTMNPNKYIDPWIHTHCKVKGYDLSKITDFIDGEYKRVIRPAARLFSYKRYRKLNDMAYHLMEDFNEFDILIIKEQMSSVFKAFKKFVYYRYLVMNFYYQVRAMKSYAKYIEYYNEMKVKLESHLLDVYYNPKYKFCRDRLNRQYDEYELDE